MKERFPIGKVIIVADRAMLSAETLNMLSEDDQTPFDYILGCKLRKNKEVREQILTCGGRFQTVDLDQHVIQLATAGGLKSQTAVTQQAETQLGIGQSVAGDQVADVTSFSEKCTSKVERSIPVCAEMVMQELRSG